MENYACRKKGAKSVLARKSEKDKTNDLFQQQKSPLEYFERIVTFNGTFSAGDLVDVKSVFDEVTRVMLLGVTRNPRGELLATVATLPGIIMFLQSSNRLCRFKNTSENEAELSCSRDASN